MLLTISTTHVPATDLGFLLHKSPFRTHAFEMSFGKAHVFNSGAEETRCTAALLLEVDPIELVRGRAGTGEGGRLDQYVNDRPYVASSFLSVAIAQVFGSALGGRSKERPELAASALPLEAKLEVVPCRGGEAFLRRLFEPLGYELEARGYVLDESFPEWGASPYFSVTLRKYCRLSELLSHLYVLVPVLDDQKHYFVGDAEVEKLLRHGQGWLAAHPEREMITRRYLSHRRNLTRDALARLIEAESPNADLQAEDHAREEAVVEERIRLNDLRMGAVIAALKQSGARRVLDLGCGEGTLLRALLADSDFKEIVGVDVSYRTLERAQDRLGLDRLPPAKRERIRLKHGALTYRDRRLDGFDAAAVVEVIEHLDPPRLSAFERVLFEFARPGSVVPTTPNAEYNVRFETLPAGKFRHRDQRFEWTRAEFEGWANAIATRFGYTARFLPVGPSDSVVGAPTQMAVFARG